METFNETLFLFLNATAEPDIAIVLIAKLFADVAIFSVPISLIGGWLRGDADKRKHMLVATVAGLLGLFINQLIGLVWQHPRPFMIGLGHTLIPHVADSSFPSDHLTLIWSVAFTFLVYQRLRLIGVILSVLGLPMAWARIYLGVHFPLDMIGAAIVSGAVVLLNFHIAAWYIEPLFQWITMVYRWVFAPFIRKGWIEK